MDKTITKKELAAAVAQALEISQAKGTEAVKTVIDTITNALADGDTVDLYGFGKFSIGQRAARTATNPRTKEPVEVPASNVVKFKASSALKKTVQ